MGSGSAVQYLSYRYDSIGNLLERKDANQNLTETFSYDGLNRLTSASITGVGTNSYQYDSIGNITYKSDVGYYTYGTLGANIAGPHAVTRTSLNGVNTDYTYDANGNQTSGAGRSISYTSFNVPGLITSAAATVSFSYDPEHSRISQLSTQGGVQTKTVYLNPRWDIGVHYEKITKGTVTEHKHYIAAGKDQIAVSIQKTDTAPTPAVTTQQLRYFHTDHLGSIDTITDEAGSVAERLSYDAWGQRRNPNWSAAQTTLTSQVTKHGYTGHEHLDSVGLIHMNGRVYDPRLARFLSADPHIQDPASSQSLNRYSYVNNNPLSYTDPSGYFFKKLFKALKKFIKPIIAIVVAAILPPLLPVALGTVGAGIVTGAVAGAIVGGAKGALIGAITGGISAGIGGSLPSGSVENVLAHGTLNGAVTAAQGGDFLSGFISGAAPTALLPQVPNLGSSPIERTLWAGGIGAGTAALTGGDAGLAFFTTGLSWATNYEAHLKRWPTDNEKVTSSFDEPRPSGPHNGVDIRARYGEAIYSVESGSVISVNTTSSGIDQILIRNGDTSISGYAHVEPTVNVGDRIVSGEPIGYSNGSGTDVPHLHYTYRPPGSTLNSPTVDPLTTQLSGVDR